MPKRQLSTTSVQPARKMQRTSDQARPTCFLSPVFENILLPKLFPGITMDTTSTFSEVALNTWKRGPDYRTKEQRINDYNNGNSSIWRYYYTLFSRELVCLPIIPERVRMAGDFDIEINACSTDSVDNTMITFLWDPTEEEEEEHGATLCKCSFSYGQLYDKYVLGKDVAMKGEFEYY